MNWGAYLDGLSGLAVIFVGLSLAIFFVDMVLDKLGGRRK